MHDFFSSDYNSVSSKFKQLNKTQNYWVSGLHPSSRSLNTRKNNISETGSVSILRWGGRERERETHYLGFLRKS
jgi:hypothetical protein